MMVVFALGSDSGFQIGTDGILDDYDDESGISVVLWCIIFVFLLVVTIWFYITQLTPRNAQKCVDDEDVEDDEERVANKLLNHLAAGKSNSKNSHRNEENDVCRPSTSRENTANYEVVDGEIRIHHSSYDWESEPCSSSKGNETGVREMSDTIVRRPSMEEMSLIFPGFLPSITEEEEEEDDIQENSYKREELSGGVCKIKDLEGDIVESLPNISSDSNVYNARADVYSHVNTQDGKSLNQSVEYGAVLRGKDMPGRQITNRKGKQPATTSKVTAEIRLRTQKISQSHADSSNNGKSRHDKISHVSKTAGSGYVEYNVFENKVSVLELEKTSYSRQNMKPFIAISGSSAHKFGPVDQNLDSNMSTDCIKTPKEADPADQKGFKADNNPSEFREDARSLPILASLSSNCCVNKKEHEDIVCIETSSENLQSEPDRGLNKLEQNNNTEPEPAVAFMPKEMELSLSKGLNNSTLTDSGNMSHAWTFYSMSESTDYNEINGDLLDSASSTKKQDQSEEIPKIVVDSYEEGKTSDSSSVKHDTRTRLNEQIDSFETDIDVDDVDLEEENEVNNTERGEFNMFLKRHVSVTDLDKVLSSNESVQEENHFAAKAFESELGEESNLETIVRGINISAANKRVYTESNLDDIWDDNENSKNGPPTRNVKQSTEILEKTSKFCSSENAINDVSGTKNGFFSRETVWTTLDQNTDDSRLVEEVRVSRNTLATTLMDVKKKEKVFDVAVSSKEITSAKVEESSNRKTKDDGEIKPEKKETLSEISNPEKKIPESTKCSEEENISMSPRIINELNVIKVSESCKDVNKPAQTLKDKEESEKTSSLKNVNRFVEGEVLLEPLSPTNDVSFQNSSKTFVAKPENPVEFGRSDVNSVHGVLVKYAKPEDTILGSSPAGDTGISEECNAELSEKIITENVENRVIAGKGIEMSRQSVLVGRKKSGEEKVEQDSNRVDLTRPVSPRRRDDVIYGRRKTKKDGNGKHADFILRLSETSCTHGKVTSPYTSESDDGEASWNVTQPVAIGVTRIETADRICKDDVNSGEHLRTLNDEGKVRDKTQGVTQSKKQVESCGVIISTLDQDGCSQSSSSLDSATQDIDHVTQDEKALCTLTDRQSSDTIETEVQKPLESPQLFAGEMMMEADTPPTGTQTISDKGILKNDEADNHNYRVERRDVQPRIEKSIVLNPEKKQLQTLINIDQIPDTHIGLKICMTGRFDVEQNKPITGLEKAEQIVANRLKRIEAEKKAAEVKNEEDKVVHKESKLRRDYVPRKAKYDETRYRRSDRGRHTGIPVDERVTLEEDTSRKIQWNDFKLDDILLDEIEVQDKQIDDISDFDFLGYQEKPKGKKPDTQEQMINENIISETFTSRELDWTLLEQNEFKNDIAEVFETGKKNEEVTSRTVNRKEVVSSVNQYPSKYTKISLERREKDKRKERTEAATVQKESTPSLQTEIRQEKSKADKKETEIKQQQYTEERQLDLDRKKRSDVLKKKIYDELSNMDIEVEEPRDKTSTRVSKPSTEPEFPVRQTKSFSELRSMDREVRAPRLSDHSSDPPTPQGLGAPPGSDDEVFLDSQERVFKTRVTVDEVRGNKRRITILNIRKKSPGSTKWRSLNDIDSLSTVQKQIFKFTSISSPPDEEKSAETKPRSSRGDKIQETVFAVSGLSPTEELDSANNSEEKKPISSTVPQVGKEVPLKTNTDENVAKLLESHNSPPNSFAGQGEMPHEGYHNRNRSAEEEVIFPSHYSQVSRYKEKTLEDKDTDQRTKENLYGISPRSPTHSTDTGYQSKDEKSPMQRQSSLSPVTIQASRSSPTGTLFALSRQSPTPLSDSENKTRDRFHVQRQSSLSPETVQKSRRSPTGTIFALSRQSPTPLSDSEKARQDDRHSKDDKKVPRQAASSVNKQPTTERSSRYGVPRKGTFFAVSRYSPATSDCENQAPGSRYQADGPSTAKPVAPTRFSSKKVMADQQETVKVDERVSKRKMEELKSAPESTDKETTFAISGVKSTRLQDGSSSSSALWKSRVPDDESVKNSTRGSSDSDSEYRITNDGWLEKVGSRSSSASNTEEQQSKIVKVTDLDSLLGGVISSESVMKRETETMRKHQTTSVDSSVTTEYNRNIVSNRDDVLELENTELDKHPHTRITSAGVQETDLDALFMKQEELTKVKTVETAESRTSLLRKIVVNRNGNLVISKENYVTREKLQPVESAPVIEGKADETQETSIVKATQLSESPAFRDLDDDVFTRLEKPAVQQNGYRADGTYSSDADSETSSLNSVPLKPKNRHTRSSLEAVKSAVRGRRSPLSSDSSSAPTPIPPERGETEYDPFHPLPNLTSTPDRNKRGKPHKGLEESRETAKESGHHVRQITAEDKGLLTDSSGGASQRITRTYSESQADATEVRRSAFTPVRYREKDRRSNSQDNVLSGITDEHEPIRYNDSDLDPDATPTFKDLANSHKSMPDLHKPQSESDAQERRVPYHSRLSAHTRLWLSQTAGIDTSNLCKDDSVGSEIFLYPSNRFQPGKCVDESFLSIASDTDDVLDDVSTRPSSPMSEFSFAGETPFGGDYQGDVIVVTCENSYCGKDEIVRSHDKTSFTSCPSCFTYYCSSECRRAHWREHKKVCYFGRINSYMRSFVYFCHKKENLKLLLSKIATKNLSSKGRGCVMVTFASPKQARKFMTSGCVLLPSPPSYSTVRELQEEGVVSKHKVNLIQQVKDFDPYQEFVLNLAIVAGKIDDLPLCPVPRHKLSTVLQCVRIPLSESLIQRPKPVIPDTNRETKVFYLPKCSRHEFVNDMEARRHYCRNISKGLRQYGIRMKKDYPDAYDSLCLYVEKNVPFKPLTVYGNKDSKIVACKIMPEGYTSTTLI